ncbi:MAG: YaiO family outer membrane beta-barrel protein [Gammaproteobacteria bacterium]
MTKKLKLIIIGLFFAYSIFNFCFASNANHTRATLTPERKNIVNKKTIISYHSLCALFLSNDLNKAKVLALKYLKKHPKDVDVQFLLGRIYLKLNETEATEETFKTALEQFPKYIDIRVALIKLELSQKDYDQASQLIDEGFKLDPKNEKLLSYKTKLENQTISQETSKSPTVKPNVPSTNAPNYESIRAAYTKGNLNSAKKLALAYLKPYPNDPDVLYLLSLIYTKQNEYTLADKALTKALKKYPKYTDIRIALITLSIKQNDSKRTKLLIQEGLKLQPNNKRLLAYQNKVATVVENKTPNNSIISQRQFANIPSSNDYTNQIGVDGWNSYVSDLKSNWGYEDLYFYHRTPYGTIGARLNGARRQGFAGNQYEVEAYPILNKYLYLYLDYANSNVPNIFPNQKYAGNAYYILPYNYVLGGGGKYLKIANTFLRIYEVSLDKYIGNTYLFSLKQNSFVPKVGEHSVFYTLMARRYFKNDPNYYLSLTGGTGKSPDLFDLLTVDFFVLRTSLIYGTFQLPLNKHLYMSFNMGYQDQAFPIPKTRILTTYGAGLKFIF